MPDGDVGELAMRGPTLFSGYWRDDAATAEDFRGGWFHMGDMFCRRPDGCYDYVDRRKYLIKSGGENIYPAEIERVLLGDARVADAVVVRRKDARWGEVPVALVVAREAIPDVGELAGRCRAALAGFKQPKEIRVVPPSASRAPRPAKSGGARWKSGSHPVSSNPANGAAHAHQPLLTSAYSPAASASARSLMARNTLPR